ncbi:hypothetical protein ACTQXV_03280 [Ligilactobacillus salivarius]|uniref:Uncharacterized protein n=2 Tax=Ligilactobacillus salivarius TaxID=1624 RepID=A0A2A2WWS7_9LACO|nr:hypothetical protein [Ligilactobacillus salivarius]ATP38315.1 hypothetical protein CR531_09135 [Ligilactobacillus salivarius]EEJ73660.1 hypothetical protein HMPREF0545_1404 [Ligilactobacillus salivarius DSM 20555 = ATCC 11741]MBE7387606.1 hypothetical protein [Ligilactobacillus salivarius]MBE7391990.1 hypothetical protein [Ligilactobacillus salivarius]MBE7938401.1 hypothetical protein [Ligilactobacillus salivarius]
MHKTNLRNKVNHYLQVFFIFFFLLQLSVQWNFGFAALTAFFITLEVHYQFETIKDRSNRSQKF